MLPYSITGPHNELTHWGRVTHICVGKLTIIGSDNGLSPQRRQAIIWTNAGILLIGPLGTNFSENLIEIQTFLLKKIRLKMSSAKCCSFCLGLNVLTQFGGIHPSIHIHFRSMFHSMGSAIRYHEVSLRLSDTILMKIICFVLFCQPYGMGHGWYPQLKMDINGCLFY